MELKKNEHGFTFFTCLLIIFILGMTLPFIASLFQAANNTPSYTQEISIQQFFQFLRDDFSKASSYRIEPKKLHLTMYDGTHTTIAKYKRLIRRQVEDKGHETYLRDIKGVLFEPIAYGLKTTITSSKGEKYVKNFTFYP